MNSMKQATTESVGDGLVWLFAALGITFSAHAYIGGLFFALAAAMITRHLWPEQDRREVWAVLLTAFLVSTIGAEIITHYKPEAPIQPTMAGLGLASRFIVSIIMKILTRAEARGDEIADRIIDRHVPEKKDGEE